jgi:hypothetical protein
MRPELACERLDRFVLIIADRTAAEREVTRQCRMNTL